MRSPFDAFTAALLLAAVPSGAAAEPSSLKFDRAFGAAGEPGFLHYQVMFVTNGAVHRMEVWRDHDSRLRRDTDRALTSIATHKSGDAGYDMTMLDHRRRISTHIERTNFYRIGAFTDWYDLGHGVRHPKGAYRLTPGIAPRAVPALPRPCHWFDLAEGPRTTSICWDAASRLPALIVSRGHIVWRVIGVDEKPVAASVFAINDAGYVHNDADKDIERD